MRRTMAKKIGKKGMKKKAAGKHEAREPARLKKKAARKSKSMKPSRRKIAQESFMLLHRQHEFKSEPMAPPEEPLSIQQFRHHDEPKKSPIPNSIKASVASLIMTALVAAFLTVVLGMNLPYTLGISVAVFVGFSIVFYTILSTPR